jgi:hypothetical protein
MYPGILLRSAGAVAAPRCHRCASRCDEWASGIDHEDGDDSPMMDDVDLGVAEVVQGPGSGSDKPRFGLSVLKKLTIIFSYQST